MMRFELLAALVLTAGTCFVIGCGQQPAPAPVDPQSALAVQTVSSDEMKFAKAISELPEEDREAALAQKFCVVETKNRLGSMGMPFKLVIEDKSVFLCCEGCKEEALKDPKATLAKADELRQASGGKPAVPAAKPEASSEKPEASNEKPEASGEKPEATGEKTEQGGEKPEAAK